jgi:hypothetical protein
MPHSAGGRAGEWHKLLLTTNLPVLRRARETTVPALD